MKALWLYYLTIWSGIHQICSQYCWILIWINLLCLRSCRRLFLGCGAFQEGLVNSFFQTAGRFPRLGVDLDECNALRHGKRFHRSFLQSLLHKISQTGAAALPPTSWDPREASWSKPTHTPVIREGVMPINQAVAIVICRSGLCGDRPSYASSPRAGAAYHNILHYIRGDKSDAGIDNLFGLNLRFFQKHCRCDQQFSNEIRSHFFALIGQNTIGLDEFLQSHAGYSQSQW